jgi:hypothetical protein
VISKSGTPGGHCMHRCFGNLCLYDLNWSVVFLKKVYQGSLTHRPVGREIGGSQLSAVVAGYTERLIGSGETRNLDSVGELHSRDGSVIAIGDGEGLSEGFGGRGLGWIVLFVSIASRVTR